jgi:WD40 repeat protein
MGFPRRAAWGTIAPPRPEEHPIRLAALAAALSLACALAPGRDAPDASAAAVVLAVAPGGGRIAAADAGGRVRVVDLGTGRTAAALRVRTAPRALAWAPDGSRLAIVGDAAAALWTPGEHAFELTLGPAGAPLLAAFAPDGRALAVAGAEDGTVTVFDPRSGSPRAVLRGHRAPVTGLAWSADGRLATAAPDRTIRTWDGVTDRALEVVDSDLASPVRIAWGDNGWIAWWAPGTQRAVLRGPGVGGTRPVPVPGPIEEAALSSDGELLAVATVGALSVWRTSDLAAPADGGAVLAQGLAWGARRRLALRTRDGEVGVFDPFAGGYVILAGVPCSSPGSSEVRPGAPDAVAFAWTPAGDVLALSRASGALAICRPRVPLRTTIPAPPPGR